MGKDKSKKTKDKPVWEEAAGHDYVGTNNIITLLRQRAEEPSGVFDPTVQMMAVAAQLELLVVISTDIERMSRNVR